MPKNKINQKGRAVTVVKSHREYRQEELRKSLQAANHIAKLNKVLRELIDFEIIMTPEMIARTKIYVDTSLKLVNKYLPDLKSVEITGDAPVNFNSFNMEHTFIDSDDDGHNVVSIVPDPKKLPEPEKDG